MHRRKWDAKTKAMIVLEGLKGRRGRGVAFANDTPNGRAQHQSDADQQGQVVQVGRDAKLRPFQRQAEAAAFGVAELFLHCHAPITQGDEVSQRVGQIGRYLPGPALPEGTDSDDADPHRAVLEQADPAHVHRLTWHQMPIV